MNEDRLKVLDQRGERLDAALKSVCKELAKFKMGLRHAVPDQYDDMSVDDLAITEYVGALEKTKDTETGD